MARLVTFGCSYTLGNGLPDFNPETERPSIFAWPNILAKDLNVECVNNGSPGASNLEILWNILHFDFKKDDTVVIMWSFFDRDLEFTHNGIKRRHINAGDSISKYWLFLNTPYDTGIRNFLFVQHANLFLLNLKIKHIFLFAEPSALDKHDTSIKITNMLPINFELVDRGSDQLHPGPESHKRLAKKLLHFL